MDVSPRFAEADQLQVTYPLAERPQMVICLRRATELALGARRGYIMLTCKTEFSSWIQRSRRSEGGIIFDKNHAVINIWICKFLFDIDYNK
jgi:hypothetical protein